MTLFLKMMILVEKYICYYRTQGFVSSARETTSLYFQRDTILHWLVPFIIYYPIGALSCLTLRPHGLEATRLLCPWDFPSKNPGVGCHFLLQGIFLNQGSNLHFLCLLHWQADSSPLSHQGSPNSLCTCQSDYTSLFYVFGYGYLLGYGQPMGLQKLCWIQLSD